MKNRKDFIKEYIEKNKDNLNIEDAMNAVFDFTNDFIEVKDELPSEENGFFNKLIILILEIKEKPGKYTPRIGRYCKDTLYNTNEEVLLWHSGWSTYGLNPENEELKVVAWRPINFE